MLASVHLMLSLYVCICILRRERVILDRTESSQPISQHHCDIDLSARRRGGGEVEGGDGKVRARAVGSKERTQVVR